jgi:amidohydrolase
MTSLLDRANGFQSELSELRRDLHRHPELSFCESRTGDIAARAVESLGWRVRRGVGRTGVVAELGSGRPLIALRADMDALPIQESSDVEYRSTIAGVMHACGHDAHVAMLTGAARLLTDADHADNLRGTVRLLFQPAEECSDDEGKSGAARMIEDGAMANVDAVFGLHIGAHLKLGLVYISPGPIMAGSDLFAATVRGRSAHAGRPHEGVDAIVLAAHAILAVQMGMARRISPHDEGTLAIGTIGGGFAENVLAESVSMRGTIRYYDDDVRDVLRDALHRGMAVVETLGGRFDLDLKAGYPPVVNDRRAAEVAADAVGDLIGTDAVVPFDRMMGAEDFASLAREAPGCFFWLGAGLEPPREHHHPAFDIDERALPIGAAALAACALRGLHEFTG